jgi:hypothetical protein
LPIDEGAGPVKSAIFGYNASPPSQGDLVDINMARLPGSTSARISRSMASLRSRRNPGHRSRVFRF